MEISRWQETLGVLSGWFRGEIKTPLGFFYKFLTVCGIVEVFGLFLKAPNWFLATFAGLILLSFSAVVSVTLCDPRKLVFGEQGYRKEMQLAYGTKTRQISAEQVQTTTGGPPPPEFAQRAKQLEEGEVNGS